MGKKWPLYMNGKIHILGLGSYINGKIHILSLGSYINGKIQYNIY
jgi:hypothetical protein